MNFAGRLSRWLRTAWATRATSKSASESEASSANDTVTGRYYGGRHADSEATGDRGSTTGPGVNDLYVGRVAGQDPGYAGETGAEARGRTGSGDSAQPERQPPSPPGGEGR